MNDTDLITVNQDTSMRLLTCDIYDLNKALLESIKNDCAVDIENKFYTIPITHWRVISVDDDINYSSVAIPVSIVDIEEISFCIYDGRRDQYFSKNEVVLEKDEAMAEIIFILFSRIDYIKHRPKELQHLGILDVLEIFKLPKDFIQVD